MREQGGVGPVLVVVKPTNACNGTCRYCSADSGKTSSPMRVDQLPALFGAFAEWLCAARGDGLNFLWHGGEPMLMGPAFYWHVLEAQREAFDANANRVTNSIQTNLSLLTPEWIPLLRELLGRSRVGTSFDPVPGWRGLRDGVDYDERWLEATELLRRSGIRYGVVYVVHRESLGHAARIYRYFRNWDPGASTRFNPLYAQGRAAAPADGALGLTADEYGEFLVELLDAWREDGCRARVAPLAEWWEAWRGQRSRLCCDCSGRCSDSHLGVTPDGSVYGCGRCIDSGVGRFGNLFEEPLGSILASRARSMMVGRAEGLLHGPCQDCEWWALCGGGCPNDGLIAYGDLTRETGFCAARKRLFGRLRELLGPPALVAPSGESSCEEAAE